MRYKVDKDGFMPKKIVDKNTSKIEEAIFKTYGFGKEGQELFNTLLEMREAWGLCKIKRQLEMESEE